MQNIQSRILSVSLLSLGASCAGLQDLQTLTSVAAEASRYGSSEVSTEGKQDASAHISLMAGMRTMADEGWEELGLDEQGTVGFEAAMHRSTPGFAPEFSAFYSTGRESLTDSDEMELDLVSESIEVDLGLRYVLPIGERIFPYIGGGASFTATSFDLELDGESLIDEDDQPDSEKAFGMYYHAGAYVNVAKGITVGLDYRVLSNADYQDLDEVSADHSQLMLTIGFLR